MILKSKIHRFINGDNQHSFDELALEVYRYQYEHNDLYRQFNDLLSINPNGVSDIADIPFLPISLFKTNIIKTGKWDEKLIFRSSGSTDNTNRSSHYVHDPEFAASVSSSLFQHFYPDEKYCIYALLPSYLENGDSSLVFMVDHLARRFGQGTEVFYKYNFDELYNDIEHSLSKHDETHILVGVTFALLDFAESYQLNNDKLSIIFTGGMKNRRTEMMYEEIYDLLKSSFPLSSIDSEYGMTEMFSQSYVQNDREGWNSPGKSIKVFPREINDPMAASKNLKTGQLAFIDLANIDTISFVLTDDLCVMQNDGRFKVLGRLSGSDIRGCNLLYQS